MPQVLVIHLGGNDLGLVKGKELVLKVIEDLQVIRDRWPRVLISHLEEVMEAHLEFGSDGESM